MKRERKGLREREGETERQRQTKGDRKTDGDAETVTRADDRAVREAGGETETPRLDGGERRRPRDPGTDGERGTETDKDREERGGGTDEENTGLFFVAQGRGDQGAGALRTWGATGKVKGSPWRLSPDCGGPGSSGSRSQQGPVKVPGDQGVRGGAVEGGGGEKASPLH